MGFRRGGEAAREEAAKSQGGFARTNYLSIEDGQQEVVRYITDSPDWIFVDQHAGVPTKNKPKDHEGNWPESMPAVCRYDAAFKGVHSDCYIDDAQIKNQWGRLCKPTVRVWALACLRQEVLWTEEDAANGDCEKDQVGRRRGFTDAMREIDERNEKGEATGNTIQERAIVVVNFAPSNYFNGLQSMYGIYGTVCDRDYVVKRTGKGKDADYDHIPLDPTPNLKPGTDRWDKYAQAVKEQNLDLEAIVSEKASDEYYARFFDPNKEAPARGGDKKSSKSDTPPAPAESGGNDVDQDRLAAMRERVRGHGGDKAKATAAAGDID